MFSDILTEMTYIFSVISKSFRFMTEKKQLPTCVIKIVHSFIFTSVFALGMVMEEQSYEA